MKFKNLFILKIIALIFLTGFGLNNPLTSLYAQSDKKVVRLAFSRNQQLKFSDFKVGDKTIEPDKDFDAEFDWIKKFSFNLENISKKPIVYLQVNINFPDTRTTGNLMSYGKSFGLRPDSKFKSDNQPLLLNSSETLIVSLEKEKEKIYKFINERQPAETIQKIELEIGLVIFEDKTAWNAGTFMRQDSNNPDRYIPVEGSPQK